MVFSLSNISASHKCTLQINNCIRFYSEIHFFSEWFCLLVSKTSSKLILIFNKKKKNYFKCFIKQFAGCPILFIAILHNFINYNVYCDIVPSSSFYFLIAYCFFLFILLVLSIIIFTGYCPLLCILLYILSLYVVCLVRNGQKNFIVLK